MHRSLKQFQGRVEQTYVSTSNMAGAPGKVGLASNALANASTFQNDGCHRAGVWSNHENCSVLLRDAKNLCHASLGDRMQRMFFSIVCLCLLQESSS